MADRTVIVTGASSGIGAQLCRRMAGPGLKLLAHARGGKDGTKRPLLEAVIAEAVAAGAEAVPFFADLSEPGSGAAIVRAAADAFGGVDQIVSNAGYANPRRVGEVTRAELDEAFATMTGALFDMAGAALPHLKTSDQAAVVAVSSFVAHTFPPDSLFPTSAAAKGGLEALSKALAQQLAPDRVTVNCVAPGYTKKDAAGHSALPEDTWKAAADRTPLGRIAEPDDIAALVEFLLGPGARHITGQVIHVDGGLGLG